jgi:hypothetical protein
MAVSLSYTVDYLKIPLRPVKDLDLKSVRCVIVRFSDVLNVEIW